MDHIYIHNNQGRTIKIMSYICTYVDMDSNYRTTCNGFKSKNTCTCMSTIFAPCHFATNCVNDPLFYKSYVNLYLCDCWVFYWIWTTFALKFPKIFKKGKRKKERFSSIFWPRKWQVAKTVQDALYLFHCIHEHLYRYVHVIQFMLTYTRYENYVDMQPFNLDMKYTSCNKHMYMYTGGERYLEFHSCLHIIRKYRHVTAISYIQNLYSHRIAFYNSTVRSGNNIWHLIDFLWNVTQHRN